MKFARRVVGVLPVVLVCLMAGHAVAGPQCQDGWDYYNDWQDAIAVENQKWDAYDDAATDASVAEVAYDDACADWISHYNGCSECSVGGPGLSCSTGQGLYNDKNVAYVYWQIKEGDADDAYEEWEQAEDEMEDAYFWWCQWVIACECCTS